MGEHTICARCAEAAGFLVELRDEGPGARAELLGEVSLVETVDVNNGRWRMTDRLVAATAAEPGICAGDVVWHVRVANITRKTGVRHAALCMFPRGSIVVSPCESRPVTKRPTEPPLAEAYIEPVWERFINGHWSRELPSRPGLYPIQGHRSPTHLHTIRARRKDERCIYLDSNDRELDPSTLTAVCWIWSEPIPALPPSPTERRDS